MKTQYYYELLPYKGRASNFKTCEICGLICNRPFILKETRDTKINDEIVQTIKGCKDRLGHEKCLTRIMNEKLQIKEEK